MRQEGVPKQRFLFSENTHLYLVMLLVLREEDNSIKVL